MSPTILIAGKLRFVIRTREANHKGFPHCHVEGPGAEASFDLETGECLASRGFSRAALAEIRSRVNEERDVLMEAWNEYHQ